MTRNKSVALLLCCVMLTMTVLLPITAVGEGHSAVVRAVPNAEQVAVGAEFTVAVKIETKDLFAYQINGTYSDTADLKSVVLNGGEKDYGVYPDTGSAVPDTDSKLVGGKNEVNTGSRSFRLINALLAAPADGAQVALFTFQATKAGNFTFTIQPPGKEEKDTAVFYTFLTNYGGQEDILDTQYVETVAVQSAEITIGGNPDTSNPRPGGGGGGGGGGGTTKPSTSPTVTPTGTPTATPTGQPSDAVFTDMAGYDWALEHVNKLASKGILKGVSEAPPQFAPASNIKRGDFMLILVRMFDLKAEFTENFSDVPQDMYYYQAIGVAKQLGIALGSENQFRPEEFITRQDLITLAYRLLTANQWIPAQEDLTQLDKFSDKETISDYAKGSLAAMVQQGIIAGRGEEIAPLDLATRAETAVMCSRIYDLITKAQ